MAKLFWFAVIIGGVYLTFALVRAINRWASYDTVPDDDFPRDALKSITITYRAESGFYLTKPEMKLIVDKINEKVKKPNGIMSIPIDLKNVVSITSIPLPTKGTIQFTVWYREKYKPPKKVKAPAYSYSYTGRGGGLFRD
jgi:hypothetical protein